MFKLSKCFIIAGCLVAFTCVLAPFANAWPSLSSLSGQKGATHSDLGESQQALITSFVGSQREVLQAQALLERAYGFKDKAELLEAQQTALASGATDENTLQKTIELSQAANQQIASAQASEGVLTSDERAAYTASLPHFALGVMDMSKTVSEAQSFASSAASGGGALTGMLTGADKLKVGLYIAKVTPSYSKSLYSVFKNTVMIGQKNGVKIPTDATSALGSLSP